MKMFTVYCEYDERVEEFNKENNILDGESPVTLYIAKFEENNNTGELDMNHVYSCNGNALNDKAAQVIHSLIAQGYSFVDADDFM